MSATNAALLRACSLLLCLVAGSLQISIKEFAVPKAIEVGEDAELQCQYELGPGETETALFVKWWWKPTSSSSDRQQMYQRIAGQSPEPIVRSNFSEIKVKDKDTIVLTNVTPMDSGTYQCEVSNIQEIRQQGTLVVFSKGTGPELNISEITENAEDGSKKNLLFIECQAKDIAPRPVLGLIIDGQNISITTIEEEHKGIYSVYANATLSIEDMKESEVICKLLYLDNNIPQPELVVKKTFVPAGNDTQSTTEMPEDTAEPDATPESLQNSKNDVVRLHSSWILLTIAVIVLLQKSLL